MSDGPRDDLAWRIARHVLDGSPVAAHWAMDLVDAGTGGARLAMTVREDMANPFGICHGGVLFTFADTCFGIACNSHDEQALAASCDIRFLEPARVGETLSATAREVWRKGRSSLYDITVEREDGTPVAMMRGYARLNGKPVLDPA